ncbi:bestrophin family protein [Lichenicoccus sp.]|uniref:bestrophin family protein n=1 Tax=Lichenicoccus sp. TaxID=2781899 RepID=UPI003D14CA27
MIVDRRAGTFQLLRESVRPLLLLLFWDILVVAVFKLAHRPWMDQTGLPIPLLGSVLVLFMSVRNNAAYQRWWEARTLWGAVVNNSRSFARQAETLARGRPDLTRAMIAYGHALRGSLSGTDTSEIVFGFLEPGMRAAMIPCANRANAILTEIARGLMRDEDAIDDAKHAAIDRVLSDLANAQGGLERILRTPLAIQFAVFPGLITRALCIVLPLSIVQELGWLTPLGSTLLGFLFVALDRIGADLENPFSESLHALPMKAITRTIEIDLLQTIGETAPPPILAHNGVLP